MATAQAEIIEPKPHLWTVEEYSRMAEIGFFDGKRVDVLTEGGPVEPGELVRCLEVHAGRVVVRRVDPIDLKSLEEGGLG